MWMSSHSCVSWSSPPVHLCCHRQNNDTSLWQMMDASPGVMAVLRRVLLTVWSRLLPLCRLLTSYSGQYRCFTTVLICFIMENFLELSTFDNQFVKAMTRLWSECNRMLSTKSTQSHGIPPRLTELDVRSADSIAGGWRGESGVAP